LVFNVKTTDASPVKYEITEAKLDTFVLRFAGFGQWTVSGPRLFTTFIAGDNRDLEVQQRRDSTYCCHTSGDLRTESVQRLKVRFSALTLTDSRQSFAFKSYDFHCIDTV